MDEDFWHRKIFELQHPNDTFGSNVTEKDDADNCKSYVEIISKFNVYCIYRPKLYQKLVYTRRGSLYCGR